MQKNSQDSVLINDEARVPLEYREVEARIPGAFWSRIVAIPPDGLQQLHTYVRRNVPSASAIKAAVFLNEVVPGAEVMRCEHLRVE